MQLVQILRFTQKSNLYFRSAAPPVLANFSDESMQSNAVDKITIQVTVENGSSGDQKPDSTLIFKII